MRKEAGSRAMWHVLTRRRRSFPVTNTVYAADRSQVAHLVGAGSRAVPPANVSLQLDWERRFSACASTRLLHLLSVVLPYPVTGGAISDGDGRLDFDIPDAGLDKDDLTEKLNALVARDAAVTERWITDEELDANPGLVKTMSVKPPRGSGKVRLVRIEGIDLQPCGGTHVRRTGEIGTSRSPISRRRASRTGAFAWRLSIDRVRHGAFHVHLS